MKRKIILLLMVMILLLGMFTPAYATKSARSNDYISLGDSIAVGTRLVQNPDFPTIPIPFIPATPILDGPGEMYYEGLMIMRFKPTIVFLPLIQMMSVLGTTKDLLWMN